MALWTKEPAKGSSGAGGGFASAVQGVAHAVAAVFVGIGRFFGFIVHAIARSKAAIVVCAIAIVLVGVLAVDLGMNWGKIYSGVHVGDIDLGGKTAEEARVLIEDNYASHLEGKEVMIFANEEASENVEAALAQSQNNALAEQQSVDEAKAGKVLWTADIESLSATFDADALVEEALNVGRDSGGLPARANALLFGFNIEPEVAFDAEALEALAAEIDAAIGEPRVNYDIAVTEGTAEVTEGHDGNMVNRDQFKEQLNDAFLSDAGDRTTFVAHAEYAPIQITREEAQRVCDLVNGAIASGAVFSFEGTTWNASTTDIGSWVKTRVIEANDSFSLEPYLDQDIAKGIVINHLNASFTGESIKVTFEVSGDERTVHTETDETIPAASDAITELERALFDPHEGAAATGSVPKIKVGSQNVPATMTLDEALSNGIVSSISSFTTEYTAEPASRQHNIHLGADLLNNSIIKADGGTWSFNDTSGDYNEEAGFQGAGAILDGEFVDAIGGGICQVATTVFNAVYESGFPILTRHNHSLYIASYPVGRDAAVAYPDLDLVWKNDSSSDVLLAMSYTDTTVTATIYGVNPEYQVSTNTGEWQEGEKFKTKTTRDDNLAPGTSYVKTVGSDGRKISIVRTVKDKNGTILHEDLFSSTYDPMNEVKVEGPPAEEKPAESGQSEEDAKKSE